MARPLGEAFVSLRPDDSGFKQDADAKIKKALSGVDGKVTVTADTDKAALKVDDLKTRIAELGRKVATARVDVAGKDAAAKLAALQVRLLNLDKRVASPKISLEGATRAEAQLLAVDAAFDKTTSKTGELETAAGSLSSRLAPLAGGGGGGLMGGLIAAGVGLAPVLATVGIGLSADAAAAAGIIGPVIKATSSAKGLAGAMAKLDPAQRAAAGSLLTLKGDYHAFQNTLKPEILTAFAGATKLAGNVLHSVQPVAAATGAAFDGFISQIDGTLRDAQWQQFWQFMGATAPSDMRLLGSTVVNLTNTLPPLLESLQPVGHTILATANDATQAAGAIASFYHSFQVHSPISTEHTFGAIRDLDKWVTGLTNHIPGARAVNDWISGFQHWISGAGGAAARTTPLLQALGGAEQGAGAWAKTAATELSALNTAASNGLAPLLAYSGAVLAARDSAKTFAQAMNKSHGEIGLNTAAQRASFSAANAYIQNLITTASKAHDAGRGTGAEITMLEQALPALDRAKTHSKLYWQEVATLKGWLDKLRAEKAVHERIFITGSGSWSQATIPGTGGGPRGPHAAAGMLVRGGTPGKDSVLVNTMPGELIVPAPMVQAGAVDHLRGRIPGFAQGGIVGSYSGSPAGLRPWGNADIAASQQQITSGIGNAMARSFAQAFAASTSAGGGAGQWSGVASRVLAMLGQPTLDLGVVLRQIATESGGNPAAVNRSDSNWLAGTPSVGLMQVIGPTFASYAGPFRGTGPFEYGVSVNPEANIFAGLNYATHRYGAGWTSVLGQGHGYDNGGWAPPGLFLGYNGLGRPERLVRHGTVGGAGGGATYNINVTVGPGGHPREVGRRIVEAIREYERGSGSGWRN